LFGIVRSHRRSKVFWKSQNVSGRTFYSKSYACTLLFQPTPSRRGIVDPSFLIHFAFTCSLPCPITDSHLKVQKKSTNHGKISPLHSGMDLPKSLYRDSSAPRAKSLYGPQETPLFLNFDKTRRPNVSRADSLPAFGVDTSIQGPPSSSITRAAVDTHDLRRMRPSQRRSFLNTAQPQTVLSRNVDTRNIHDTKTSTLHPTYSLEGLNDMIKSVGRAWSMDNASSEPRRGSSQTRYQSSSPASTSSHSSHTFPRFGDSSPTATTSNNGESQPRPRVATSIKIGRSVGEPDTRSRQIKSTKGLMLPPTAPIPSKHSPLNTEDSTILDSDLNPGSSRQNAAAPGTPRFSKLQFLDERKTGNCTDGLVHKLEPHISSQETQTLSDMKPSVPLSQDRPKRSLGMRRTSSTNGNTSTLLNYKPSQTAQGDEAASETGILSDSVTRPKTFKVPWANHVTLDDNGRSSRAETASPNLLHSRDEQAMLLGLNRAKSMSLAGNVDDLEPGSSLKETDYDGFMVDNPDSSYSFDEIDPEELHQVLSQRGA
jgi:hypothetical protein